MAELMLEMAMYVIHGRIYVWMKAVNIPLMLSRGR